MKKSIKKISSSVVAFIVICSIMNVSPLFVVDTEAAVKVPALDTNIVIKDGMYLVSSNITSSLGNKSKAVVTKDILRKKVTNNSKNMALIDLGCYERVGELNENGVRVKPRSRELYMYKNDPKKPTFKNMKKDDVMRTDWDIVKFNTKGEFVVELKDDYGDNMKINSTATWYKVTDVSKDYKVSKSEILHVDAFKLSKVNKVKDAAVTINSNNKLVFKKKGIKDSAYGLYLCADMNKKTAMYRMIHLHKDSSIKVANDTIILTAREGDAVNLQADVTVDKGVKLYYNWEFWNEDIAHKGKALKINSFKAGDAGTYSCEISDGNGSKKVNFEIIDKTGTKTTNYFHYAKIYDENMNVKKNATLESAIPTSEKYRKIWYREYSGEYGTRYELLDVKEVNGKDYNWKNSKVKLSSEEFWGINVKCMTLPTADFEKLGIDYGGPYITIEDCMKKGKRVGGRNRYDSIEYIIKTQVWHNEYFIKGTPEKLMARGIYFEEFELVQDDHYNNSYSYRVKLGGEFNYKGKIDEYFASFDCDCYKGEESLYINPITVDDLGIKETYEVTDGTNCIWKDFEDFYSCQSSRELKSYHNLIYVSDLAVSAANQERTLPIGTKNVALKVNVKSELPVTYRWKKITTRFGKPDYVSYESNNSNTLVLDKITNKDIYVPAGGILNGYRIIEAYNYYVCEVYNGFERIEIPFKINKQIKLTATSKIVASSIKTNSIKFTWSKVNDATGYRVYMYKGGKWVTVKSSTTAKTYTQTGLKPGTKYKFAVKAYRKDNGKVIWADKYKTITVSTDKKK